MSDSQTLEKLLQRDQIVWDDCAEQYEQSIVGGHPDIIAYEEFEEDFLDRVFIHLMRDKGEKLHLFDVGCGSARLHLHYGLKSTNADELDEEESAVLRRIRKRHSRHTFDRIFHENLIKVSGLDFSQEMINIARRKLEMAGLTTELDSRLFLETGSAFDLEPLEGDGVPFAVAVCNSIGVMQGPQGAQQLFASMRNAAEKSGGVAMISCYRKSAIPAFALGNYESTMNVSGQPVWLDPLTYSGSEFLKMPRGFKRAHDPSDSIIVNVLDMDGTLVQENFQLTRNKEAVEELMETGHIRMHSEYESRWYAARQIAGWIEKFWGSSNAHHIMGKDLDSLRGEPVQFAIYDPKGRLDELVNRWL